jgi:hypothetical protein
MVWFGAEQQIGQLCPKGWYKMGWWADITGKTAARAATKAGELQQQAAQEAAALTKQYEGQITGQFDPYNQFGQSFIPMAQQAAQQQQNLFGEGAGDAVMNSPMFQAMLAQSNEEVMNRQGALGRVGTGESQQMLQDAALRTGYGVLQGERQAAMQNLGSLMGGVGMGQQAAGSIANALQNSLAGQTGFNTGGAAAQAGGIVGAANAKSQGAANLLGAGTSLLTGGFSNPFSGFSNPFGGGNQYTGGFGGNMGVSGSPWGATTPGVTGLGGR